MNEGKHRPVVESRVLPTGLVRLWNDATMNCSAVFTVSPFFIWFSGKKRASLYRAKM
jgi:hypothetical protein